MSYNPVKIKIVLEKIHFKSCSLYVVPVLVENEEYEMCEKFSHQAWCNKKSGRWGRGYLNTPDDPRLAERTGFLGEMAFSKITNSSVNFEYIKYGVSRDFIIGGLKIELKTNNKPYGRVYVRHELNGYVLPLESDVYFFGYKAWEDVKNKKSKINFLGYLLKNEVIKKEVWEKETWKNYVCPYSELNSMKDIIGNNEEFLKN